MNDNLSNSNNGNRNSLPNNNMDIFYAQSNHNPEMHKYIFQGSEYIGQLDFWSATEIKEFGQLLGFECKFLVLDIGSGLGGPICYLSRTYGCNAIGVDACLQNVEISKERARSLKLEQKISFLFGENESILREVRLRRKNG